ncbi:MAG TPA: Ig-like domain-containing protein [Bacillota bacterium]|nr:Ig-like domain-containing protein [Bacillota bacterium]
MLKRLSVITAVFFLLAAFAGTAFSGTLFDSEIAINDALQNCGGYYQGIYNFNGDPIHYVTLPSLSAKTDENGYSYGFLTYGRPHGDQKDGQYRYIGYTYYGEDYTNMDFPADKFAGFDESASRDWVSRPWKEPNKSLIALSNPQFAKFPGDGDSKYYGNIVMGLIDRSYGVDSNGYVINWDTINEEGNRDFYGNIEQYVHILAPPTRYAWGMGRMWHRDQNGSLWYVTIPLYPDGLLDQPMLLVTPPVATVNVGGSRQYKATYYPKGLLAGNGQDVTKSSAWTVEDTSIASIGADTGLATGKAPGMTRVVATYTANGKEIQGTARLIVEEQLNLKVTGITLSPDPGQPNQLTSGVITVKNESEKSFTNVKTVWRVRHSDGTVLDENTITTDLAAGESKQLPFSFTPDGGDTYSVAAMVNPDGDNPPNEINFLTGDWPGDNRMEVSYYAEEPCTDISVTAGIDTLSVESGGTVTVTAFVKRADDGPDRAVPVSVAIRSAGGSKTGTLYLDRGNF